MQSCESDLTSSPFLVNDSVVVILLSNPAVGPHLLLHGYSRLWTHYADLCMLTMQNTLGLFSSLSLIQLGLLTLYFSFPPLLKLVNQSSQICSPVHLASSATAIGEPRSLPLKASLSIVLSASSSVSSVAQSCLTLRPHGLQHARLPCPSLSSRAHVHRVGDAIQPSHPLSSPFPPAFNLSQHQAIRFFSSESVLHIRWPKFWTL